jgi:hypothetical protein
VLEGKTDMPERPAADAQYEGDQTLRREVFMRGSGGDEEKAIGCEAVVISR